jgi:hypothetical protein
VNNNTSLDNPKQFQDWLRRNAQILYGFFGWYLINGLIWLLLGLSPNEGYNIFVNIYIFPLNLLALIVLSVNKSTRKIGLGVLIALALNLLLSLVVGLGLNGVCFIPFFVE